jgi:acyl-coenzyme A synthetase/AMP-(fatty) acid ligase
MADLPLIRGHRPGAPFAYRNGKAIPVEQFLRDVSRLAERLPDRRYLVNVCADRYRFCVGLGAALVRRQVNLLPPNFTPDFLSRLQRDYPSLYCLADTPGGQDGLETFQWPLGEDVEGPVPPTPLIPEEQIVAVLFTSGSTAEPLQQAKTWGSLARSAWAEAETLGVPALPGLSVLATVPPQHMYGLESSVLLIMQAGIAMHVGRPFFPADICEALAALPRPRALVTSPMHLKLVLAEPGDVPPVDVVVCGTAPLSPSLALEAEKRFGGLLHELYGCTEAGQVASRRTSLGLEWQTFPRVRLYQQADRTWVEGGHVVQATPLGDVIELRDERHFTLHGRTSDLINIAGKRTSLASLNYHLAAIPGVEDGAFVVPPGTAEDVYRLVAFVVAPALTSAQVLAELRRRVDPVFIPRPLYFVDALPRNETGKLTRQVLEALIAHTSKAE